MMTLGPYRVVYLPVGFAEAADRIADLVEAGRLQIQQHWLSREACQEFIDRQPRGLHAAYAPTVTIIRDAGNGFEIERGGGANDRCNEARRDGAPLSMLSRDARAA